MMHLSRSSGMLRFAGCECLWRLDGALRRHTPREIATLACASIVDWREGCQTAEQEGKGVSTFARVMGAAGAKEASV